MFKQDLISYLSSNISKDIKVDDAYKFGVKLSPPHIMVQLTENGTPNNTDILESVTETAYLVVFAVYVQDTKINGKMKNAVEVLDIIAQKMKEIFNYSKIAQWNENIVKVDYMGRQTEPHKLGNNTYYSTITYVFRTKEPYIDKEN